MDFIPIAADDVMLANRVHFCLNRQAYCTFNLDWLAGPALTSAKIELLLHRLEILIETKDKVLL
jgi:hypothetical protein